MIVKEITFSTTAALDVWKAQNYPFVYVMSMSGLDYTFAYETSARLPRPEIHVEYIDYHE